MGWFPGYVIDIETGVRLNVAYGEDSYLSDLGGRDMIFNPAKVQKVTAEDASGLLQEYDPAIFRGANSDAVFGGKHFLYIWRMDSISMPSSAPWKQVKNYGYDGGELLFRTLDTVQNMTNNTYAKNTLLTPHVAFLTKEAMVRRAKIEFDNVMAYLDGKPENVCKL